MKTLHLVCNAHLDPVWMWDWSEGASAALATFYSAVQLAKDYDYVFCHNEAVLYEFVEKYDPALFKEIQGLVKKGKWSIMGGWYLQPDCTIPSGEAFIRQISVGREYFQEKFNATPTSAMNVDSFGHTRGLVQILKKCGYDSYFFSRPMPEFVQLPANPFLWKGYDGSVVKALRFDDYSYYGSALGHAKEDILRKCAFFKDQDIALIGWGVGNHGGGPSRKDLQDIQSLQKEKKGEWTIIHSTPEAYFAAVDPKVVYEKSLLPCFVKSYSSISAIKKKQVELEHVLFKTEKACSIASLAGGYAYPRESLHEAEKSLCAMGFHDILSGTCVESGLKSTLRRADQALEDLQEDFLSAFHSLAERYVQAHEGENPMMVFSFQPYPRKALVTTEFLIPDAIVSDTEGYALKVYQNGHEIPSQVVKEEANINYDRRKRVAYLADLAPLNVTSVVVRYEKAAKAKKVFPSSFSFKTECYGAHLNEKTGCLDSFVVGGKEYLSGNAFEGVMFDDNADPWGWYIKHLGKNETPFALLQNDIQGPFAGLSGVHYLEEGDLYSEVEALFSLSSSFLQVRYTFYHHLPYIDIHVHVLWNEKGRGLKLRSHCVHEGTYFAEQAYGREEWAADGLENVGQRYVGVEENGSALVIYNDGVYGNSKNGNALDLTLLNGSAYCAHPIGDRPLLDETRYVPYIEQGVHDFSFRLSVNKLEESDRLANEFIEPPYSLNVYPHGDGKLAGDLLEISNPNIVLESFRKRKKEGYVLRLFNNADRPVEAALRVGKASLLVSFTPHDFETLVYEDETLSIAKDASIY